MLSILTNIWAYRAFILNSVRREFHLKYRNSLLGATWSILSPMAMILVYTVIFTEVMRARLPGVESDFAYSIYLCAGSLTWGLFSEITGRMQNVFLDNASLLKKVNFPRICLPLIVVFGSLLNFSIIFGLFTLFLIATNNFPGSVYLAMVPLLVIQIVFSVGLGMVLGVLNVFFRDIGQFFGIVLQFWFWLTPIVYPVTILPEKVRQFMAFNPMVDLMVAYQGIFTGGRWPEWSSLWLVMTLAAVLCVSGFRLFRRHVGEIVDEL